MNPWPDLRPVLQGVPWVIVGAVATRAYMPERATQDLNILIRAADGAMVRERLESAGYHHLTSLTVPPGFRVYSPQGVDVKVILGKHLWLKKALAHPRQDPAGYPVLDLPYLILMKIESSRTSILETCQSCSAWPQMTNWRAYGRQYPATLPTKPKTWNHSSTWAR